MRGEEEMEGDETKVDLLEMRFSDSRLLFDGWNERRASTQKTE